MDVECETEGVILVQLSIQARRQNDGYVVQSL